jgi:sensor histidine kinase YesM
VRNSAARQRPDAARTDMRLGVGLGNTRERLKTLFDDDYELELIHAEDSSVVARIRIPFIDSAAQEAA